jgi:hypothetical protein
MTTGAAGFDLLAKKFSERLHRFDVRAENLERGQDRELDLQ